MNTRNLTHDIITHTNYQHSPLSGNKPKESKHSCTLEPLRKQGRKSLICADTGLETARVIEVRIDWGGAYGDLQLYQSADCFLSPRFKAKLATLPEQAHITSATFMVKYIGDAVWRRVAIHPPDSIIYDTATDRLRIEPWLIKRQFVTHF